MTALDARDWFGRSAHGFVAIAHGIQTLQLDAPGLGEWSVRDLLGHACRALSTIETYLAAATADPENQSRWITSPAEYFDLGLTHIGDPAAVAQRGREAGAALGNQPIQAATALSERVQDTVASLPDDTLLVLPLGRIRLIDYLPTRAFELTVHGIDLARATGQASTPLAGCVPPALALSCAFATEQSALTALMALTGRDPLPTGFSVFDR